MIARNPRLAFGLLKPCVVLELDVKNECRARRRGLGEQSNRRGTVMGSITRSYCGGR